MKLLNWLEIISQNQNLKNFFDDITKFEISIKKLNQNDFKRIELEYPNFLKQEIINQTNKNSYSKYRKKFQSISCITLIKQDLNINNYIKIKKIKFYLNESTGKIIKMLQN